MSLSVDFKKITTLIFDIDGTLTDGRISWDSNGNAVKFFNVQDMHWIKLALRAGLRVGVLSGRDDAVNRALVRDLKLSFAVMDAKDKLAGFEQLLQSLQICAGECLYMGDDTEDLPVMRLAGIAATVADAPCYMDVAADFRTQHNGGCGAVREVTDHLLMQNGKWRDVMSRYGLEDYKF